MDIKQSFLHSLEGLFNDQAEALVEAEGLVYMSVPIGTAVAEIIRPNTVVAWTNEQNQVEYAFPGDFSQLVNDTGGDDGEDQS